MARFDRRVYGPGPLRSPGSRVLLAIPGVDYPDDVAAEIRARAINLDRPAPDPAATVADPAEDTPVPDADGLIRRGNGWYELPNGDRVRGHANALEALAALDPAPDGSDDPEAEEPDDVDDPLAGDLKPLGGDWFELPNGERVRGREAAEEQLAGLYIEPGSGGA